MTKNLWRSLHFFVVKPLKQDVEILVFAKNAIQWQNEPWTSEFELKILVQMWIVEMALNKYMLN